MSFDEIRFPVDISYGAMGGPEYSTDIVMLDNGFEKRNINWSVSRGRWNVSHGVKTKTQFDELLSFFRSRRGKAIGFRFKDWMDYQGVNQNIGTGNGSTVAFQLRKSYVSLTTTYRDIFKPVDGTVLIYVNSVLKTEGTDYTIDYTTGIVTFSSAPSSGLAITSDYEYDVPVRFDTDIFNGVIDTFDGYSLNDIVLVELRQ